VEVEGGGQSLLRITDDGSGMTRDEAELAVRRHATSKIACIEDLAAVGTLGFRGEALPSIASVSRFQLTTRPAEAVGATRVTIEGGSAPHVQEVAGAAGTTVAIRDLFYNVPARRKFLKRPATESAHISDACLRTALVRPELRLTLVREGRTSQEFLPVPSVAQRAEAVFRDKQLSAIEGQRDGVRVEAHLAPPEQARSGATALYLFVNDRPVKERTLARAVAFAYGSVLPPGRYPVGVVRIHVDPERVDVNVHPQKAEVRFADGRAVLDAVTRLVASGLGTTAWSGPASRGASYWQSRLGGERAATAADGSPGRAPEALAAGFGAPQHTAEALEGARGTGGQETTSATQPPRSEPGDPWGLSGVLRAAPEGVSGEPPGAVTTSPSSSPSPPSAPLLPTDGFFASLRFLGQVRKMLLVCEGDDGLYVIDQHAADERVRYHQLSESYRSRRVATQRLLFPERVECTYEEAAAVEEHPDELLALGFECRLVGSTTVAVHAVPALVQRATPARLLRDVTAEVLRTGDRAFGDAVDMALATMACHGAIRAGDALSPAECTSLLESMDRVDDFAGHCPHGRPVVYQVSFDELERRLGR
jgi:DNA mismatch repair protein MutL